MQTIYFIIAFTDISVKSSFISRSIILADVWVILCECESRVWCRDNTHVCSCLYFWAKCFFHALGWTSIFWIADRDKDDLWWYIDDDRHHVGKEGLNYLVDRDITDQGVYWLLAFSLATLPAAWMLRGMAGAFLLPSAVWSPTSEGIPLHRKLLLKRNVQFCFRFFYIYEL